MKEQTAAKQGRLTDMATVRRWAREEIDSGAVAPGYSAQVSGANS
jgi:hypothetical protein